MGKGESDGYCWTHLRADRARNSPRYALVTAALHREFLWKARLCLSLVSSEAVTRSAGMKRGSGARVITVQPLCRLKPFHTRKPQHLQAKLLVSWFWFLRSKQEALIRAGRYANNYCIIRLGFKKYM